MKTLHFHDVSNWQPGYVPTGSTFAKATEGATFVDKTYTHNRNLTVAGGWPFAAYHYVTAANPMAQAKHALSIIGTSTPTMWDIEKGGGSLPHLCALHDAFVEAGGHARLVYLPHWYWEQIGSPSLQPLVDRELILVSSNYPSGGYTDSGPGWMPYGGMRPKVWQYTSTPLDTNAFKGTTVELASMLAGRGVVGQHPGPLPTPTKPGPHTVKVGESLSSIADGWRVTLGAVEKANPHAGHPAGNFNVIYPGNVIQHP